MPATLSTNSHIFLLISGQTKCPSQVSTRWGKNYARKLCNGSSLRFKRHCIKKSVECNLCPTTYTQILILQIDIPASLKEKEVKHY